MIAQALGWDNHRKFSKVSLMELMPDGQILAVERARLEHDDKDAMRAWLSRLDPEIPVALEATFGWPWVADLLEELGHPVHLGHPPTIRALAKHEAKTDRCDGDRLGKFQLRGILPESYLAPPEVRQRRERIRYRMALSALRTSVKNRAKPSCIATESYMTSATCSARRAGVFWTTCNCPMVRGKPSTEASNCSTT